ncbi:hypothetical protein D3C81_1300230 [compost metagenome]
MATKPARLQAGVVSIEFAVVFGIFFLLFYALIGYTLPLLLAATYQELSAEALREAIRHPDLLLTDPDEPPGAVVIARQRERVSQVIGNSWLPAAWAQDCTNYPGGYLRVDGDIWSVCLRHASPGTLLPSISLFGWRVPQLPPEIRGEASIRIR